jgi:hypothetical protein
VCYAVGEDNTVPMATGIHLSHDDSGLPSMPLLAVGHHYTATGRSRGTGNPTAQSQLNEMHRLYGGSVLGIATGLAHVCRRCPFGTNSLPEFEEHRRTVHPIAHASTRPEPSATLQTRFAEDSMTVDGKQLPPFLLYHSRFPAADCYQLCGPQVPEREWTRSRSRNVRF